MKVNNNPYFSEVIFKAYFMKKTRNKFIVCVSIFLIFLLPSVAVCQSIKGVFEEVVQSDASTSTNRILLDADYFVWTAFTSNPASFTHTMGGYISTVGNKFQVILEFNSIIDKDSIKVLNGTITLKGNKLDITIDEFKTFHLLKVVPKKQELEGKFLMAGRVTDQGESRRRLDVPRKTMKFLIDNHFQWIAFNTETFEFSGTGGGTYSADKSGAYIEKIEFFSKNAARVGAILPFTYNLKEKDWFHQGKSSAGEPMHEIWSRRTP